MAALSPALGCPPPPLRCVWVCFKKGDFAGFLIAVSSALRIPVGTQQGFSRSLLKEETKEAWSLCSGPGLSESTTE